MRSVNWSGRSFGRLLSIATVLGAGAVAAAGEGAATRPAGDQFVVHEWGTFTSFAGSDGVSLEYRPLTTQDLPGFVYDRPKQMALWKRQEEAQRYPFVKTSVRSLQRMETPVTYFYTDRPRTAEVRVEFPKGLLTEFYPSVRAMGPAAPTVALPFAPAQPAPWNELWPPLAEQAPQAVPATQPVPVSGGMLDWGQVELLPDEGNLSDRVPATEGNDHYGAARETDSAVVRVDDKVLGRPQYEKFLFYRGVGNFALPLALRASGGDRFVLENSGETPVRGLFLVGVNAGRVRFAKYGEAGRRLEMALPEEAAGPEALADAVTKALVAEGLYAKEAAAMVKVWKSSWFGEEGTRLLYVLPAKLTDELLPLTVAPKPDETVRVMVGRMEVLTPEREREVEGLVGQLNADDPAVREGATKELEKMGRFAEPALDRVVKASADPETRARAEAILKKMRAS